jgi:hypothetical protein
MTTLEFTFPKFSFCRKKGDPSEDPSLAAWYQYGGEGAYNEYWDENGYEYDYEAAATEGWYQDKDGEWRQDPAYAQVRWKVKQLEGGGGGPGGKQLW